ncbi:16S rRNA (adenine(1518)-N(6)/adenine(1519)-N(6))-dimethyltransferase RsmA [Chiayiivirga flava]|uniref:Ribosomal RNA small subunit methyltransferase A n=1 Tax=Chiayiivirga flava TaxID=659595 RepID=A0A7W8D3M5_9GAMM|nr:16S rRNA (adenine(1518)-N(6)/adenine(1519)-N(6))-dimethyltransferase RsmA [Chiayiivirga flava]MBB5207284.1 16S rRNA (adenine1518-N6/adenine1519-N6)-dimethyltransferase [Chiayiivirga flava]
MSDHHAKKQLGQHFLHDAAIIDRIVRAIDPRPGERIVEIGPGQGALTIPLLRRHGALTVIEFDRDLLPGLARIDAESGALEVVNADVLTVDFTQLARGSRMRLVGNLPYNISSPILFHALDHAGAIADMHFMLQKEVVDRMAAEPGSKVYGRLSVMLQAFAQVTPLFDVPPGAFRPPPKVDSAVVRVVPRAPGSIGVHDARLFAEVVKAAFSQRRKTLRNALAPLADADTLRACGVDPGARAEDVAVPRFVALGNALAQRRSGTMTRG